MMRLAQVPCCIDLRCIDCPMSCIRDMGREASVHMLGVAELVIEESAVTRQFWVRERVGLN